MDIVEEISRRRGRGVGPLLQEILQTQTNGEYYSEVHYRRLAEHEAVNLDRPYRLQRCIDIHGPNCPYGCRSCHSCRQKTVGRKTECVCGRGTGFWCGSCLNTRMGQNIDEVFRSSVWRCPSCLEICNCSGRTCDRHMAGLGCTRILSGEARDQGYKSTAHYLIQTHLEMKLGIAPALNVSRYQLAPRPRRELGPDGLPLPKRARLERLNLRSLTAAIEEELRPTVLESDPSSAQSAALQLTELWLSLPSASAPAAHPTETESRRTGNGMQAGWLRGQARAEQPSRGQQHTAAHPFTRPLDQHLVSQATTPADVPLDKPKLAALFGFTAGERSTAENAANNPTDEAIEGAHHRSAQPLLQQSGEVWQAESAEEQNVPHQGIDSGDDFVSLPPQRHRSRAAAMLDLERTGLSEGDALRSINTTNHRPTGQEIATGQLSDSSLHQGRPGSVRLGDGPPAEAFNRSGPVLEAENRQQHASTSPFAAYIARSEGTFGSLAQVALEYYNPAYQEGSEDKQAAVEAIELCLEEMQQHLMAPVAISMYNKDFEVQLRSEDERPEHDMRDHDCLKDACQVLLIAADASPRLHEKAIRLLICEEPFVEFGKTDPQGRAILLKTAFAMHSLIEAASGALQLGGLLVKFILGCLNLLIDEREHLLDMSVTDTIDIGPLKVGPVQLLDQQRQLQEDMVAVQEADDLLLQLLIGHVQEVCSNRRAGADAFLQKDLLCLIGRRRVSEAVRFRANRWELLDKQHRLAQRLHDAEVGNLLQQLATKSQAPAAAQNWGFANAAANPHEDDLHTCPKVDAIKDKLLARVMGLFIAVGRCSWAEMASLAIKPYAASHFWLQASLQERQQAFIFLAVGLQAAPSCLGPGDILFVTKLWLWLSLDFGLASWNVFRFTTQVLGSLPALQTLFAGFEAALEPAAKASDDRGFIRASLVEQLLARWKELQEPLSGLVEELPAHLQRLAILTPQAALPAWQSACARIVIAICQVTQPLPRALDFITKCLSLLGKWMHKAAEAHVQAYMAAQKTDAAGEDWFFFSDAHSAQDVTYQRRAMQETCLGSLSPMVKLLAVAYTSLGVAAWQRSSDALSSTRDALSPALWTASAGHTPGTAVSKGSTVDQVSAELVAAALAACGSPSFQHYVLGTFLPLCLQGSERSALNAARFLAEFFHQPSVRHSAQVMQLLLPQLLGPLLEALSPSSQTERSLPVQEAVVSFIATLTQSDGRLLVPGTSLLSLPTRNTVHDVSLFQRGEAPSNERYEASLQTLIQTLCCHCINSVDFALKGRAAREAEEEPSHTAPEPLIRALTKQGMRRVQARLSMLLGACRSLEAVKAVCTDSRSQKLGRVPPDFYLRQAEQALTFLVALTGSGEHGREWALPTCKALKPFLIAPRGTDDLRRLYQSCIEVLSSAGQDTSELYLPQERVATSFEEMSSTLIQASSGRQSCFEPARRSPLAEVQEAQSESSGRDQQTHSSAGQENAPPNGLHHAAHATAGQQRVRVEKLEGSFRSLKESSGRWWSLVLRNVCLFTSRAHQIRRHWKFAQVAVPKQCVLPDLRALAACYDMGGGQEGGARKVTLTNVVFVRPHSADRDTAIVMYSAGLQGQAASGLLLPGTQTPEMPVVKIEEEELSYLPATLPALAPNQGPRHTQPPGSGGSDLHKTNGLRDRREAATAPASTSQAAPSSVSKDESQSRSPVSLLLTGFHGNREELLGALQNLKLSSDLGANARALQAALSDESLTTREAVLNRAVAFLLP